MRHCTGESDVFKTQNEEGHRRPGNGLRTCRMHVLATGSSISIHRTRPTQRGIFCVLRGRAGHCSRHQRDAHTWGTSSVRPRRRQSRTSATVHLVLLRRAHRHADHHLTRLHAAPRNGVRFLAGVLSDLQRLLVQLLRDSVRRVVSRLRT